VGKNEVLVQGLASSFDSDSLRVDGRGSAVIREVQYQQRAVEREETDLLLAKQYEAEIGQLQLKLTEVRTSLFFKFFHILKWYQDD
jgi:hypothetical protein